MTSMLPPGYDPVTALAASGLVLVIGRPATGKTRHVVDVATRLAASGRAVRYLSLDQEPAELIERGLRGVEVDDRAGRTLDEVVALVGSLAAGSVLVIDYVQLLQLPGVLQANRMPDTVRALNQAGVAAGVTVIAASQLNRDYAGADSLETLPEWVGRLAPTVVLLIEGA